MAIEEQQKPTIDSINHTIPIRNIEEIPDIKLGTKDVPVTNIMVSKIYSNNNHQQTSNNITTKSKQSETTSIIKHPIIERNGNVNINNVTKLQNNIIDKYLHTSTFYKILIKLQTQCEFFEIANIPFTYVRMIFVLVQRDY